MDLLSETLAATRLQSSLLADFDLGAPWAIDCEESSGSPCHAVREGGTWLLQPGLAPLYLTAGDLILFARWDRHILASSPELVPELITDFLVRVGSPVWRPGELLDAPIRVQTEGTPRCRMLSMVFRMEAPENNPLLTGLPKRVLIRRADVAMAGMLEPTMNFITDEAQGSRPGYAVISNRLAELLFMQIVRVQLLSAPEEMTGLLRGLADPVLARSLAAIHAQPEIRWTVANLGSACGLSRSSFAQRFHALVGEPPKQYLTRLRMARAAERLSEGASVKVVAGETGYATSFAFSETFKRHFGCAPSRYAEQASPMERGAGRDIHA